MLTALKQHIAPTDQAREVELISRYNKLKEAPHTQDLDSWLREWEKIYTDCKELKLPDVDKDRPIFDFLNAVSSIAPDFAGVWRIGIQKKQNRGKKVPGLYKILELFRNDRRLATALKEHMDLDSASDLDEDDESLDPEMPRVIISDVAADEAASSHTLGKSAAGTPELSDPPSLPTPDETPEPNHLGSTIHC
jgi:hypothetical protein